jgi:hypothetical protein
MLVAAVAWLAWAAAACSSDSGEQGGLHNTDTAGDKDVLDNEIGFKDGADKDGVGPGETGQPEAGTDDTATGTETGTDSVTGTDTVTGSETVAETVSPTETLGEAAAETSPCINPCPAAGLTRCDQQDVQECVAEGECLAWQWKATCPAETQVCLDGACQDKTAGGSTCKEILGCFTSCNGNLSCEEGCTAAASSQAILQISALQQCAAVDCGDLINAGKSFAAQACMLQECKDEWQDCNGPFGDKTCKDTLMCAQGCGTDTSCIATCMTQASYDGLLQMYEIESCIESECPDALQDTSKLQECVYGPCMEPAMACFSS